MTRTAIAGAALALLFAASGAQADTHTLAKSGGWKAFGGTTNKGRPVCGVSHETDDSYFGLKFFSGDDTFTIQISNKDWRVKDGNKYRLVMRLDDHPDWNATSTGMHFNDGDPGLEYDIRKQELKNFVREFNTSRRLRLRFRDGDMDNWTLDLNGVDEVKAEFDACQRKLK